MVKTPCEWLKSWTELKYRPDSDNIDEYIQKFKELATLLAYPEDHQVQIFKMMMPENIELRIKDITTLNDCIDEVKSMSYNLPTLISCFKNEYTYIGKVR